MPVIPSAARGEAQRLASTISLNAPIANPRSRRMAPTRQAVACLMHV